MGYIGHWHGTRIFNVITILVELNYINNCFDIQYWVFLQVNDHTGKSLHNEDLNFDLKPKLDLALNSNIIQHAYFR